MFAFAITLLVLNIALPEFHAAAVGEVLLTHALLGLWPKVLAYVLSFAVIGVMWQNHHAIFRLVETVDRKTVFLNLVLLAVTAFIPFATSTLGAYPAMRPSTFLYGLTLTCSAAAYNLLLYHLIASGAFRRDVTKATIRQTVVAFRVGLLTYSIATLTALLLPLLSFALYIAVVGYYAFPRGVDDDLKTRPRRA